MTWTSKTSDRLRQILDLYAPYNERGERDPKLGVISREEAMELLERVDRVDSIIDKPEHLQGCSERLQLPRESKVLS